MIIRLLAFAGLAAGLTVTALTVTPSAALQKDPYQCYTDDGYGRYRPCASGYKRRNPNWRNGPECMMDDGFGRMRPCSSHYWWPGAGPLPGQEPQQGKKGY